MYSNKPKNSQTIERSQLCVSGTQSKSQIIESYFLCEFWPELEDIHVTVHVNLLEKMV